MDNKVERKFLSAADIYEAKDVEIVEVEVPEWGGTVRLRTLTGVEAQQFVGKGSETSTSRLVALSAVDENGKLMFTEDDVDKIQGKSFRAILRLQREIIKLNGLSDASLQAVKNA